MAANTEVNYRRLRYAMGALMSIMAPLALSEYITGEDSWDLFAAGVFTFGAITNFWMAFTK